MAQAVIIRQYGVFDPVLVNLEFVGEKVVLGKVFLPLLSRSPFNIIPRVLHTH
jgi:hypothetical protein